MVTNPSGCVFAPLSVNRPQVRRGRRWGLLFFDLITFCCIVFPQQCVFLLAISRLSQVYSRTSVAASQSRPRPLHVSRSMFCFLRRYLLLIYILTASLSTSPAAQSETALLGSFIFPNPNITDPSAFPLYNYHDTVNTSWVSRYETPWLHLWCDANGTFYIGSWACAPLRWPTFNHHTYSPKRLHTIKRQQARAARVG